MSKPNSGFVHRAVNHRQREFSKRETIFGKEILVSTNAAEGLFGRLKTWMRAKAAKKVSKESYGGLLVEFLWTANCSARKADPFAIYFSRSCSGKNNTLTRRCMVHL